jgi:hypothetical protein
MEDPTTDRAAFDETVVFLSYFKDLKDPRQQRKITYSVDEILLLCLLAVLAGAESVVNIALFGCKKRELLRRFRPSRTARLHTTIWATSWRSSTTGNSRVASSPGSPR